MVQHGQKFLETTYLMLRQITLRGRLQFQLHFPMQSQTKVLLSSDFTTTMDLQAQVPQEVVRKLAWTMYW